MKRGVQDRFRRTSDKKATRQTYINNDKNSSRNRILSHYFPHHSLHPLNPDYVSPKSSKTDVKDKKSVENKEESKLVPFQNKARNNLPHYRISNENFSVKKQYEESKYTGISMPKQSTKSYKLKRTDRYINDPESYSGENTQSSGSKKSSRSREKKDRNLSNSHRSYQSTTSARSNPEEEEYENTGRNRERYESQLARESNELTRKNQIPFSNSRVPESDNGGPPRDAFLPPAGFPPATEFPGYPVVLPNYPFPGPGPAANYPPAPAPVQPYSFNGGYPNGFPYPPAPFVGGANPTIGHLNQSPTNLNYYNYTSPADGRQMNQPVVPPTNASYNNPFVYNVEVDNQLKANANKRQVTELNLNRPRDIVGVSTNQKQIYSGNENSSFRGGSTNNGTHKPSLFQSQMNHGPGSAAGNQQKPFPYDLQHYRYCTETAKIDNSMKCENQSKTFNGTDSSSIPYEQNYDWNQQRGQKKQDYIPDYNQAIENAFTYSGSGSNNNTRMHKQLDLKEYDKNMGPKHATHNYESYDLNSNVEVKNGGEKIPYADQSSYNPQVGYGYQNNVGNVDKNCSMAGSMPYHQYNPNNNHYYHHPPLKSTRYLNMDSNFKDPGTSRQ